MTIIVTGGAGFIGSNFIFHMLKEHLEDRIVCLDKLTYAGNLSTLKDVMGLPNFRFVKMDICDREAVYGLFEEEPSGCGREFRGGVACGSLDRKSRDFPRDEYHRHSSLDGCVSEVWH